MKKLIRYFIIFPHKLFVNKNTFLHIPLIPEKNIYVASNVAKVKYEFLVQIAIFC